MTLDRVTGHDENFHSYSYIKQRREAIVNRPTIELLHAKADPLKKALADQDSPKRIQHDLELLDEVIQKGFNTLSKMEVISPVTAIKAIEMATREYLVTKNPPKVLLWGINISL
ncbi:hypothetical protein [Paenibacillus chitinolyticus]|uniref:hypothetical protein n=1 Tax=Paenibacillus chitinolyticus TaxID=79263 RepID=UPI0036719101